MEGAEGITIIEGPLGAETTEETTIIPAWRHPHSNSRVSKIIYQCNIQLSNPHPCRCNAQRFSPHLVSKIHKVVVNRTLNDNNGLQTKDKAHGGNTVGHMGYADTTVMSVPTQLQATSLKQLSTTGWEVTITTTEGLDFLGVERKQ